MTAACWSNMVAPTPGFRGWRSPPHHAENDGLSYFIGCRSLGFDMFDIRASKPLAKAIGVRRETQRHRGCLTRQIMARAGRQATTVTARGQPRRRSGPRTYQ